jgi:crossover junction endodeoxyribonuclease RuvC
LLPAVRAAGSVLLGIDPGLRITGYGLIESRNGTLAHLLHGTIRTSSPNRPGRLVQIHRGVLELLEGWKVDEVAIEKQFVAVNPNSAFAIGEARAAAMLAAAECGLPIFEYAPTEVKQAVTSYGRGSKLQIQEMVRLQFALPELPKPSDAADALAVAICHAARRSIPQAPGPDYIERGHRPSRAHRLEAQP